MRLPGLVRLLAEDDERGEPALTHIARVIREAGHLPTTKRGRGASEMGIREAANMVIASAGADAPANASTAVEQYRPLTMRALSERSYVNERSNWWSGVTSARDFGQALERFLDLDAEAERRFGEVHSRGLFGQDMAPPVYLFRSLRLSRPYPSALLTATLSTKRDFESLGPEAREKAGIRVECRFLWDGAFALRAPFSSTAKGRSVDVTVRDAVLRKLTDACAFVHSDESDEAA